MPAPHFHSLCPQCCLFFFTTAHTFQFLLSPNYPCLISANIRKMNRSMRIVQPFRSPTTVPMFRRLTIPFCRHFQLPVFLLIRFQTKQNLNLLVTLTNKYPLLSLVENVVLFEQFPFLLPIFFMDMVCNLQ